MKLKKGIRILLIAIIAILVVVGGIFIYKKVFNNNNSKEVKIISEIKEYGYSLKETKSKEYKKLFKNLQDILDKDEVDEELYLETITKMFIMDLYTLDDKVAKTDIGGIEFVHSEERSDYMEKVADTLYKYLESNIYGDRKQELPIVTNVEIVSTKNVEFKYLDTTDKNAYQVQVKWEYKKDLGYEKEANIILVHEDNKLSIVEMD